MPYADKQQAKEYVRKRCLLMKELRKENPESFRAVERKSYQKNKKKYSRRKSLSRIEWAKKNPERARLTNKRWRDRKNALLPKKEPSIKIGDVFGELTVIDVGQKGKCGHKRWVCQCGCGKETLSWQMQLIAGKAKSCGCVYGKNRPIIDQSDAAYNRRLRRRSIPFGRNILKRDGETCLLCLSKETLHAHHIHAWAKEPNLRFNSENLLTLCKKCHIDVAHSGNLRLPLNPVIANILFSLTANQNCPLSLELSA